MDGTFLLDKNLLLLLLTLTLSSNGLVHLGYPLEPQTECYDPILKVMGRDAQYMNSSQYIEFVKEVTDNSFEHVTRNDEFPPPLDTTFNRTVELCKFIFVSNSSVECKENEIKISGVDGSPTNVEKLNLYYLCAETINNFKVASYYPTSSLSESPSNSPAPSLAPIIRSHEIEFGYGFIQNDPKNGQYTANNVKGDIELIKNAFQIFIKNVVDKINQRTLKRRLISEVMRRLTTNAVDLKKTELNFEDLVCPAEFEPVYICRKVIGVINYTVKNEDVDIAQKLTDLIDASVQEGNLEDLIEGNYTLFVTPTPNPSSSPISIPIIKPKPIKKESAMTNGTIGMIAGVASVTIGILFILAVTIRTKGHSAHRPLHQIVQEDTMPRLDNRELNDNELLQDEGDIEDPDVGVNSDWELDDSDESSSSSILSFGHESAKSSGGENDATDNKTLEESLSFEGDIDANVWANNNSSANSVQSTPTSVSSDEATIHSSNVNTIKSY